MASRFAAEGSCATVSQSTLVMTGSATIRGAIYYVAQGVEATPADATIITELKTTTAAGTATAAVTPAPLDASDRVAICTAGQNTTVSPTYTGVPLLKITMNQRSHYQFYAQEGGEFLSNPAAGDGFGMDIMTNPSTPELSTVFHWKE